MHASRNSRLSREQLMSFYNELLEKHGYQGWWPINSRYHPRDYSFPRNEKERFEIIVGAVLTQNTSWRNVERALSNLRRENLLSPKLLLASDEEKLAEVIRSAGYFRQKAKKLKFISKFYLSLLSRASWLRRRFKSDGEFRHALLQTWGIGPETADSILLYAYKKPFFVVDAYTKRLFAQKFDLSLRTYEEWQELFHSALERDYELFNEFHALIVAEGKLMR